MKKWNQILWGKFGKYLLQYEIKFSSVLSKYISVQRQGGSKNDKFSLFKPKKTISIENHRFYFAQVIFLSKIEKYSQKARKIWKKIWWKLKENKDKKRIMTGKLYKISDDLFNFCKQKIECDKRPSIEHFPISYRWKSVRQSTKSMARQGKKRPLIRESDCFKSKHFLYFDIFL